VAGDAYQQPIWSWLHAARDAGASSVNVVEATTAATPESWLVDNQSRRLVTRSAAGVMTITIDRGAATRLGVDRLLIPSGHNLAGRLVTLSSATDGTFVTRTTILMYSRARGADLVTAAATVHAGTCVFDFPESRKRYLVVEFSARASEVGQLGELWLTRKETPAVGFAPEYEYGFLQSVDASELRSGAIATVELGTQRRTLSCTTGLLSGTDQKLYNRMVSDVGTSRDPLWIDPTVGDYETTIDDMEGSPAIDWTVAGGIIANFGAGFAGVQSVIVQKTGGTGALDLRRAGFALDLRGCVFQAAVKVAAAGSPLAASTGFTLYLTDGGANYSGFKFGTNHIAAYATWYTLSIDVDNDVATDIGGNGVDPANVVEILFRLDSVAIGGNFQADDVRYIKTSAEPWLARISKTHTWKQSSSVPVVGEYYERQIDLVESIA